MTRNRNEIFKYKLGRTMEKDLRNSTLLLLLILSISLYAQNNNCGCASSVKESPVLRVEFSNGQKISVCGFLDKKISDTMVLMSEFNIFNCETGESLAEYRAKQYCRISFENGILSIVELKYLPAGENWNWKPVPVGLEQFFVKDNKLIDRGPVPYFNSIKIEEERVDNFFAELDSIKSIGKIENPEEILGKLEILSLNNNKKAISILFDFENYFNYTTDGAIAEQWEDAVAMLKWVLKIED